MTDVIRLARQACHYLGNAHCGSSHCGVSYWFGITSERGKRLSVGLLPCRFRRLRAISEAGHITVPGPDRNLRR
jgi:hypothetical protein